MPEPVISSTRALPLDQLGWLTISAITPRIGGVRWSTPTSPRAVQGGGLQKVEAAVAFRLEMLPLEEVKVPASPVYWPRMVRSVVVELFSSTMNCR